MQRRAFLRGAAAISAVAMLTGPARADDRASESVMHQLRALGYLEITRTRTLLGRIRITARRGPERREIVLDPRSGEILRDLSTGGASLLGSARDGSGTAAERGAQEDAQAGGEAEDNVGDDDASDDRGGDDGGDEDDGNGSGGNDDRGGDGGDGGDDD